MAVPTILISGKDREMLKSPPNRLPVPTDVAPKRTPTTAPITIVRNLASGQWVLYVRRPPEEWDGQVFAVPARRGRYSLAVKKYPCPLRPKPFLILCFRRSNRQLNGSPDSVQVGPCPLGQEVCTGRFEN